MRQAEKGVKAEKGEEDRKGGGGFQGLKVKMKASEATGRKSWVFFLKTSSNRPVSAAFSHSHLFHPHLFYIPATSLQSQ